MRKSDYLISDNLAIQDYYLKEFGVQSFFIPYGADAVNNFEERVLSSYSIDPRGYFLLIARLEPENNIEMILYGFAESDSEYPFVVIGDKNTRYGRYLQDRYKNKKVCFLGAIYDKEVLDNLRHFSRVYFHGHSVGGTNPSLLEAMAAQALVAAHDNMFNRAVLGDDALYFQNRERVCSIITNDEPENAGFIKNNLLKIEQNYSWDNIISEYERLFTELLKPKRHG